MTSPGQSTPDKMETIGHDGNDVVAEAIRTTPLDQLEKTFGEYVTEMTSKEKAIYDGRLAEAISPALLALVEENTRAYWARKSPAERSKRVPLWKRTDLTQQQRTEMFRALRQRNELRLQQKDENR